MDNDLDESPSRGGGEGLFPLLMGFFLFWLWIAEDFPFTDKLIMTSLVFGVEFMFAIGLTEPVGEIQRN